ncbi:MAG: alanine racemase [Candidatus Sumerlaeia bacterium]|nr:alanine racemase [Candidatus Sumerlaeia bacterium]
MIATQLTSVPFAALRETRAVVDCAAFRRNLDYALRLAKKGSSASGIIPVIKADAYGHGMVPLSHEVVAWGSSWAAVATADEALLLRSIHREERLRLLVMGPVSPAALQPLAEAHVSVAIGNHRLLKALAGLEHRPAVHLKVDTGMGRYGFLPEEIPGVLDALGTLKIVPEGLMTHFSVADEVDEDSLNYTAEQLRRFAEVAREFRSRFPGLILHTGNSGAAMFHPEAAFDYYRPGMMLYGAHPNPALRDAELSPVMSLRSAITSVHHHPAGSAISYGRTFVFQEPGTTGILPIGYGDGLPRRLSNRGQVILRGRRIPMIGRVCMDQTMVNITGVSPLPEGEEVVLFGIQGEERILLEEFATWAGTIPYEITCQIGRRIPREYVNATGSGN